MGLCPEALLGSGHALPRDVMCGVRHSYLCCPLLLSTGLPQSHAEWPSGLRIPAGQLPTFSPLSSLLFVPPKHSLASLFPLLPLPGEGFSCNDVTP